MRQGLGNHVRHQFAGVQLKALGADNDRLGADMRRELSGNRADVTAWRHHQQQIARGDFGNVGGRCGFAD